jgi:hypothetical protein
MQHALRPSALVPDGFVVVRLNASKLLEDGARRVSEAGALGEGLSGRSRVCISHKCYTTGGESLNGGRDDVDRPCA